MISDHVTLTTGVMMLKIQIYITWINCILKYAEIDKRERFQIVIIFHNITVFAVFLIKQM